MVSFWISVQIVAIQDFCSREDRLAQEHDIGDLNHLIDQITQRWVIAEVGIAIIQTKYFPRRAGIDRRRTMRRNVPALVVITVLALLFVGRLLQMPHEIQQSYS